MFERFTDSARYVVTEAKQEAIRLRHRNVGTEHLLLALLTEGQGATASVLRDAGVSVERVRADIERIVGPGGAPAPGEPGADSAQLLSDDDAAALRAIGIDLDAVRAAIEETFGEGSLRPPMDPPRRGLFGRRQPSTSYFGPTFSPRAKKVLELSLREALHLGHNFIGAEHILLGLIREGEGLAAFVLTAAGLDLADLRRRVLAALRPAV